MKIKVIGSGSMWTKHNSACYLIDNDIMVDFPNGACKYLYKESIKPTDINNILLTHFHGDHYFDIPFYLLNKSKSDNKNTNIFCSKEGKRKIRKLNILAFPNSFHNVYKALKINFNFNNNFIINDYNVSKVLVNHGRMKPCYGYIFTKDNIKVGFTGDTTLCESVEEMAKNCNFLFCDCMRIDKNEKHMGIDSTIYLSNKYQKCTFVVSHLDDETRGKLMKMNINNVIVPEDGITIDI